jgi:hypothetical protein
MKSVHNPDRWIPFIVGALILVIILPFVVWKLSALSYEVGIAAGVPSSLAILFVVYAVQRPKFRIEPATDAYDAAMGGHWVHLRVRNTTSGFMGGGTAFNCRGSIDMGDGRVFTPKWESRPNPFRYDLVRKVDPAEKGLGEVPILGPRSHDVPGTEFRFIESVDKALMPQAKIETIRPREEKIIDVAVRFPEEDACFIHEPENYLTKEPKWRPQRTRLGVGSFPFKFHLEWDTGASKPMGFVLENPEGGDPGSLRIRREKS